MKNAVLGFGSVAAGRDQPVFKQESHGGFDGGRDGGVFRRVSGVSPLCVSR